MKLFEHLSLRDSLLPLGEGKRGRDLMTGCESCKQFPRLAIIALRVPKLTDIAGNFILSFSLNRVEAKPTIEAKHACGPEKLKRNMFGKYDDDDSPFFVI